jgi:hypothetical protein
MAVDNTSGDIPNYRNLRNCNIGQTSLISIDVSMNIPFDATKPPHGHPVLFTQHVNANLFHWLDIWQISSRPSYHWKRIPIGCFCNKQTTVETAMYGRMFNTITVRPKFGELQSCKLISCIAQQDLSTNVPIDTARLLETPPLSSRYVDFSQ